MKISAVLIDNGSELLEKSLNSLVNQTMRPQIVFVGGEKTNYEIVYSMLDKNDKIIKNIKGIFKARLTGILKSDSSNIVSCDSDTIYFPDYVENAYNALKNNYWVKAGTVYVIKEDSLSNNIRKYLEKFIATSSFLPIYYEHLLAHKKESYFKLLNLSSYKIIKLLQGDRFDTASLLTFNLVPVKKVKSMKAYVNFPTFYFRVLTSLKPWRAISFFNSR